MPDDVPEEGPSIPPLPAELGSRDVTTADPPRTHADSTAPARPTAPPYRLSGASDRSPAVAAAAAADASGGSALHTADVQLRPKHSFVPGASAAICRATGEVNPDDLIELEFEQGERLWIRGDDFRNSFGQTAARRDATGVEELEVPLDLRVAARGLESRGPIAWAIKGLEVFGVDLAGRSARMLAARIDHPETPTNRRQRPGVLYRCSTATGAFDLTPVDISGDTSDAPWLLFLHGTLSSTWGSFGELWAEGRGVELAALRAAYGDRIIAFEHATLTESPVENALALATLLPPGARLHIVSHSRGGLVGELLCRAAVVAADGDAVTQGDGAVNRLTPFTDEELTVFASEREDDQEHLQRQLELLRDLRERLQATSILVERFVRVACPALGTTLASGRLDRWLSVVGSIAGAALPGTPLGDVFKDIGDFVAAIVKQRTDPATLPGLEAQMPDSRCIRLVTFPRLAANLATEFIRMGVRAVVAAGWAVDDAAAATFATTFYDEMLKGRGFGEAVRTARCAAFDRHPASNTWGAYQCYGDPEYRLVLPTGPAQTMADDLRIVSPAHAVQDLSNIAARLKTGATASRASELERAQRIETLLEQKTWPNNGAVLAALARVSGEAGNFEAALRLYRRALSAEDAAVSARDIEQLANLEVRHAAARWREGSAADEATREDLRTTCVRQIDRALAILGTLTGSLRDENDEPMGQTAERLSLLASAHKRLALIQGGDDRLRALTNMEKCYREAGERAASHGGDVAYPLLNAVAAHIARRWQQDEGRDTGHADDGRAAFAEELTRDLAVARTDIAARLAHSPTFWRYVMMVDADLLERLGTGTFDDPAVETIATSYLDYRAVASTREFGSVFAQLEFMTALVRDTGVRARLEALRQRLQAAAG